MANVTGGGLGGLDMTLSVVVHAALIATVVFVKTCTADANPQPLFPEDQVVQVQMASLPKSTGLMPDRATRAPDPIPALAPEPDAAAEPVNPNQMTYADPKAKPDQGQKMDPEEAAKLRAEALRQIQRDNLVKSMEGPISDRDRVATSPDGSGEYVVGFGSGGVSDPAWAQYSLKMREILIPIWAPLPAIIQANPNLLAQVDATLDGQGNVREVKVRKTSRNNSFDESCVRAVYKAGRLPLPPNAVPGVQVTVPIQFRAKDAQ